MRNGKGEAEPAMLIGGQPPAQPSDTRLGRASGVEAQDSGLQSGEQSLRGEYDAEGTLVCECKPHVAVQTRVHASQSTEGCSCWESGFPQAPKGTCPGMDWGHRPRSPPELPPPHIPPSRHHRSYLKESHRLPRGGCLSRGSKNSSSKLSMS